MILKLLFVLHLAIEIFSNEHLILDYLIFKKVKHVIGFSCYNQAENFILARKMNELSIRIAFNNLNNETRLHPFLCTNYWNVGIYIDLRCSDERKITSLFTKTLTCKLYDELHHWLVISADIENITQFINDEEFGVSTDFVVAHPVASGYELLDIYNPWKGGGGKLNSTLVGLWSVDEGLEIHLKQSKYQRRSNFFGISMRASFFGSPYKPKNMSLEDYMQQYTTDKKEGLSKFGYTILVHLSELLNISMIYGEVKNWKKGDTKGPLVRALHDNEIDIAGSPLVMTVERTTIFRFVYPTWPFRTCFMFRKPESTEINLKEFLQPFETTIWYSTTLMLTLVVITMAWALQYETRDICAMSYSNSILLAIGTLCQQGTNFELQKVASRFVYVIALFCNVLLYDYYSAAIVSTRLNEPMLKINDSLLEMAKTKLKLSSEPMLYFKFLISKPDWETKTFYTNRWTKISESEQFMLPERGMELVRKGGFAYHTHPNIGYPIIMRTFSNREICELTEVHLQSPVYATLGIQFNSSLFEVMKIGFAKLSEVGIRNRQVTRWSSNKPTCHNDEIRSIDIYDFSSLLIVLLTGICIAIMILLAEIFVYDFYRNKRRMFFNEMLVKV